jgi:polysaccharide biosynthesis transport protein
MKVAEQVVRRQNLTEDPRFVVQGTPTQSSSAKWLDSLKSLLPTADGSSDTTQPDSNQINDHNHNVVAAKALQKITNVRRRGLTNVIALDITIDNAKDAARLANAYADTYIEEQVNAKLQAAGHTESALSKRVSELGEALRRSETQIKAFALAQASQSSDETTRRDVDRLQANIAVAAREASNLATRLREANSYLASGNYAALGKAIAVPEVLLLDEQRRSLEQRLQRPTGEDTDLASLRMRLEVVNSQLQSVSNQNVEALRHQSEMSGDQLASLRNELEQTVQKSDLSTDISVKLFRLQQEATATRQLYQDYLGRLKAMVQQRNILNPDVYVVAEASAPPYRSFPPRLLLVVLGSFAGFVIAVGLGYVRDNYPRNIKFSEELEAASLVPNIGAIPNVSSTRGGRGRHPEREIYQNPLSAYSEAIRRLGIFLRLHSDKGSGLRSLLVTSTERRDGRSTIALSLARDASRSGLRVVLLDCDLRHPGLHSILGISNDAGINQLLLSSDSPSLASVVQSDPHSTCSVITSGGAEGTAAYQALHSIKLDDVIRELETKFDLVIVDSPPLNDAADALMMAKHTDAVLLLARSLKTRPGDVWSAVQELSRAGSENITTALNFATRQIVL